MAVFSAAHFTNLKLFNWDAKEKYCFFSIGLDDATQETQSKADISFALFRGFLKSSKVCCGSYFGQFPLSAIASRLSLANLLPEILFVQESKSLSVVIRARNSAAGSLFVL